MKKIHTVGKCILIGDDTPSDHFLIKRAFQECGDEICLEWVRDGEQVIKHLEGDHRPDIVLLDLYMPKRDGLETLKEIKARASLAHIPVVVFATSSYDQAILQAYRNGAAGYICKPSSYAELKEAINILKKYWFDIAALPEPKEAPAVNNPSV